MNLDSYTTDEGLIPSSSLRWDGSQLRLKSGERVWVEPSVSGVASILRDRSDLWKITKIRVSLKDWIVARAPIFGVPFDVALEKLLNTHARKNRPIKSMFRRIDADYLEANHVGVVATMLAHVSFDNGATGPELTLEIWQIPNVEAKTFYLHGIFLVNEGCFVHLDGATMYHEMNSLQQLFRRGIKAKGYGKGKLFRLDGRIAIDDVRVLGTAFLPLYDLSTEYLLSQT